jgi:hypothetical protein
MPVWITRAGLATLMSVVFAAGFTVAVTPAHAATCVGPACTY